MSARFLSVVTSLGHGGLPAEASRLQNYLYGSAEIVAFGGVDKGHHGIYAAVVKVTADDRNVAYLTNYQAERLMSGLFGVSIFDTFDGAANNLRDIFDVTLDNPPKAE